MFPLPPSFHEVFLAKHDIMWNGISLWSFRVSCPSCAPANFLCTSSLLAGRAECEEEEAFMLYSDCSAVSEALVCYQCCFSYKSKADHHMVCCEEN